MHQKVRIIVTILLFFVFVLVGFPQKASASSSPPSKLPSKVPLSKIDFQKILNWQKSYILRYHLCENIKPYDDPTKPLPKPNTTTAQLSNNLAPDTLTLADCGYAYL